MRSETSSTFVYDTALSNNSKTLTKCQTFTLKCFHVTRFPKQKTRVEVVSSVKLLMSPWSIMGLWLTWTQTGDDISSSVKRVLTVWWRVLQTHSQCRCRFLRCSSRCTSCCWWSSWTRRYSHRWTRWGCSPASASLEVEVELRKERTFLIFHLIYFLPLSHKVPWNQNQNPFYCHCTEYNKVLAASEYSNDIMRHTLMQYVKMLWVVEW